MKEIYRTTMKPTTLLTLCFLLYAFIFITGLPLTFSQYTEQVLDTNSNPIFPGGEYYIIPAIRGPPGGGVWPGKTGSQTSPVTVLQDYSEVVRGKPVKFRIAAEISPGIIFTGTPLDIAFAKKPHGASSAKWVVVDGDDFLRPWVGIGGADDHPGKYILEGLFSIQKYGFGYKLVFTPTFSAPPGLSFDIGRHDDKKGRRLILAEEGELPFEVVFVDASGIKSVV